MEFYLSGNHFTLVPNIKYVLLNIKNRSRRIVYGSITLGSPCILPPPSDLHQKAKTPSKRTHKALNYTYAFLKEALRSRTIWNQEKTCSSPFPALMSSQSVQFGRDFIPGLSLDPLLVQLPYHCNALQHTNWCIWWRLIKPKESVLCRDLAVVWTFKPKIVCSLVCKYSRGKNGHGDGNQ